LFLLIYSFFLPNINIAPFVPDLNLLKNKKKYGLYIFCFLNAGGFGRIRVLHFPRALAKCVILLEPYN